MKDVKRIFFLDKEEAEKLKGNNVFILRNKAEKFPCYELEDGSIMYPHYGCPSEGEVWYETVNQ